ncbi:MAG: amidohydrolase family protein [Leucobacter sp.]|nr:amidohydrolase family protein [Leucobacter sp.]
MLDAMDQYDISEIWVSATTGCVRDFEYYNKKTFNSFTHAYPSRFKGYAILNPYYPDRMREEIKRCFEEYGFIAIKIHSWIQAFILHQPIVYEIMDAAGKYQIPIMFHDGSPPYADTLQIAALAEKYPEVNIILGHSGLYDSYRSAIQAAKAHKNIWLILQGPTINDMKEIIQSSPQERLLFGTDYCCGGSGWKGETLIRDRLDILRYACSDSALLDQINCKNALSLLKR